VVKVVQERERDPREGLTREQMSIVRQMARGASRSEAAAAHGVSEERVKGWEPTSWFREALSREHESPWTAGKLMAATIRADLFEKPTEPPRSSSARRTMALDLLGSGVSITETASSVGYTRQHLSQLVNHDPDFSAELERRRVEDQQRRADRLWHLWDEAARVIATSLAEGNPRIAMEVLKLGARGVTDVHVCPEDPPPAQIEPTPAKAIGEVSIATEAEADLPSGPTCRDCGLVTRTEGGLKLHLKAKHGS
jgi:helix-turn-helix protein